jgi:hypothetical protein
MRPYEPLSLLNIEKRLGDGLSLSEYARGGPVNGDDPLGLFVIGISAGDAAARANMGYQAYETANKVFDLAKTLQAGVGWQQAMIGFAAEMVADKAGGKYFEKLLDSKILSLGGDALRGAARITDYAWHHVFPKFLNAGRDGIVALLPKALHEKFHGELYRELSQAGIKLSGKPDDTWFKLFRDSPDLKRKAVDILRSVTQRFDAANGTQLYKAMLEETQKAGF